MRSPTSVRSYIPSFDRFDFSGLSILIPYGSNSQHIDRLELYYNAIAAYFVSEAISSAGGIPIIHPVQDWNDLKELPPCDRIFNLCDGFLTFPWGFTEARECFQHKPCTGASLALLNLGINKPKIIEHLGAAGLPVPQTYLWNEMLPAKKLIAKPCASHGSFSIDMTNILDPGADPSAFRTPKWMFQDYLSGEEYTVALIGEEVVGMLLTKFGEVPIATYNQKWDVSSKPSLDTTTFFFLPEQKTDMANLAIATWKAIGGTSYCTIGLRCDEEGTPYVIDVNPNCGLSQHSTFRKICKGHKLDYSLVLADILYRDTLRRSQS